MISTLANANGLHSDINKPPFLNGTFNPKYEGQGITLSGVVLEILPTEQIHPIYKLNLNNKGIHPIWVISVDPTVGNEIKVGETLRFRGYITATSSIDSTGELESIIPSKLLLMATKLIRQK